MWAIDLSEILWMFLCRTYAVLMRSRERALPQIPTLSYCGNGNRNVGQIGLVCSSALKMQLILCDKANKINIKNWLQTFCWIHLETESSLLIKKPGKCRFSTANLFSFCHEIDSNTYNFWLEWWVYLTMIVSILARFSHFAKSKIR